MMDIIPTLILAAITVAWIVAEVLSGKKPPAETKEDADRYWWSIR